jgi:hypothetical protein
LRRPAIPRELERQVLLEAGHRCAIPTCRHKTTEIAHIVPWNKVKEHTFENLIALCPNCHDQYDRNEIDRKSMLQYKTNLFILNSRYGDLERRTLRLFAEQPNTTQIKLPGGNYIFVMYLIEDGYLIHIGKSGEHEAEEFPNYDIYELTAEGREFIGRWVSAAKFE